MSTNLDPFTHIASLRCFLAWICSDPNNVTLLEQVGDTTIDYHTLDLTHPDILCVMSEDDPNEVDKLVYKTGRWTFIIELADYPSWQRRYNTYATDDVDFQVSVDLDGQWVSRIHLTYNVTTDSITLAKTFAPDIMAKILKTVRTRIASVVRGYETYLKEQQRYDNLRQLLKIKTRKKK
jgi:hypothetical protein